MTAVQLEWRTHNQSEYISGIQSQIQWFALLTLDKHRRSSKGSYVGAHVLCLLPLILSCSLSTLVWSGRTYHTPLHIIPITRPVVVVPLTHFLPPSTPSRCPATAQNPPIESNSRWWKALFDRPCLFVTSAVLEWIKGLSQHVLTYPSRQTDSRNS